MFGQAKPLASLSSGLLARKGQARPAMRPQGFAGMAPQPSLEDLGWNDMGQEAAPEGSVPEAVPDAVPVPAVAAPVVALPVESAAELPDAPAELPAVLVEREALADELEAPRAVRPVSTATAARLRRETAHPGRAAFTLRLDAERHLKLRLASAVTHRSAQQLVQHALDHFLATVPEVDALVAQLPAPTPRPARAASGRQQRSRS